MYLSPPQNVWTITLDEAVWICNKVKCHLNGISNIKYIFFWKIKNEKFVICG